jgi:hypothetical protein
MVNRMSGDFLEAVFTWDGKGFSIERPVIAAGFLTCQIRVCRDQRLSAASSTVCPSFAFSPRVMPITKQRRVLEEVKRWQS